MAIPSYIDAGGHQVILTNNLVGYLSDIFTSEGFDRAYVLMDENTYHHCFGLLAKVEGVLFHPLVIGAGEQHKSMSTASLVCQMLMEKQARRNDVLINLGGGVVCDVGGFVASIYQRGIRFMNIPTSLLAMSDAAIGGKTGVDLAGYKNMVGTFNNPINVVVDLNFLQTLPEHEWRNGLVESIKHALIGDTALWEMIQGGDNFFFYEHRFSMRMWDFVARSVKVKAGIVKYDPKEENTRRHLNFGHTVGHALETWSMLHGERLVSHGEAVAIGLVCESYLSQKLKGLNSETVSRLKSVVRSLFPQSEIVKGSESFLISAMKRDKKANSNTIPCVVLEEIGHAVFFEDVDADLILESFEYFNRF